MGRVRATITIPHVSAVPANAAVNTMHFVTAAPVPTPPDYDYIMQGIKDFYAKNNTGAGALTQLLSANMVPSQLIIKLYDLDDPMPRPPRASVISPSPNSGGGSFPHEVAMVLSTKGLSGPGVNPKRNRGRMFIGPLSDNASYVSRSSGDVRPSLIAREILAAAATELAKRALGASWAIYSRRDNDLKPIVEGFIDDAFDTQRRRGTNASTRTTWT